MVERAFRRNDSGASDFVSTILLVLGVVVLGGALSAVIMGALSQQTGPAPETYGLVAPEEGDTALVMRLSNGGPVELRALGITLQRGTSVPQEIAPATWSAPGAAHLSAGDTLSFPIAPAVAADETLTVRVFRKDLNVLAAQLVARSGFPLAAVTAPSIDPNLEKTTLPTDATSSSRITARIHHPDGALVVSHAFADVGGAGRLLVPLNDQGRDGDEVGGDGIWSGFARFPTDYTPPPDTPTSYPVFVHVVDATGRTTIASEVPYLAATIPVVDGGGSDGSDGTGSGGSGGSGSGSGGSGSGTTPAPTGATGNFTGNTTGSHCCNTTGNFSGNSSGNHTGNVRGDVDGAFVGVGAGKRATEGTRFKVPTSANVTKFTLENWTWDRYEPTKLDFDGMVIRVLAGNNSWSAYMKFDYTGSGSNKPGSTAKLVSMTLYSNTAKVTYVPTGTTTTFTPLNLNTLKLNLLDPIGSGQWVYETPASGTTAALYQNANVTDNPFVVISFMRDERGQGQGSSGQALETGIFGADVIFV